MRFSVSHGYSTIVLGLWLFIRFKIVSGINLADDDGLGE